MSAIPITEKQLDYIEILIDKRASCVASVLAEAHRVGVLNFSYDHLCDLDKKEASALITWLKEETE